MPEIKALIRNLRDGLEKVIELGYQQEAIQKQEPGPLFKVISKVIEPLDEERKRNWEYKKSLPSLRKRVEDEIKRVFGQLSGHRDMFYEAMVIAYGEEKAKSIWNNLCDEINKYIPTDTSGSTVSDASRVARIVDQYLEALEEAV